MEIVVVLIIGFMCGFILGMAFMRSITNKSGQAFYNIGKERLLTTMIPIPPYNVQQDINMHIQYLFSKLR